MNVMAFDPEADPAEVHHEYGMSMLPSIAEGAPYAAIILAVKHRALVAEFTLDKLKTLGNGSAPVLIDVKGFFRKSEMDSAGFVNFQL